MSSPLGSYSRASFGHYVSPPTPKNPYSVLRCKTRYYHILFEKSKHLLSTTRNLQLLHCRFRMAGGLRTACLQRIYHLITTLATAKHVPCLLHSLLPRVAQSKARSRKYTINSRAFLPLGMRPPWQLYNRRNKTHPTGELVWPNG